MKNAALVVLAVTLAGCGLAQQAEQRRLQEEHAAFVKQRMAAATVQVQACAARRKAGEFGYVESARCGNDALLAAFRDIKYPYMDLVYTAAADRLRTAEALDGHQISETEGQARFQEVAAHLAGAERQRNVEAASRQAQINASNRAIAAAEQQNYVQMMGIGLGALQGPPAINCVSAGNVTSCR